MRRSPLDVGHNDRFPTRFSSRFLIFWSPAPGFPPGKSWSILLICIFFWIFVFFTGPWEAGNACKTLLADVGTFLDIGKLILRTFKI